MIDSIQKALRTLNIKTVGIRIWLKRWRRGLSFAVILGGIITGIGLYSSLTGEGLLALFEPAERMQGDVRIAVLGFDVQGPYAQRIEGRDLAEGVRLRLEKTIGEEHSGMIVSVWGPEKVGSIKGKNDSEKAEYAEKIARSHNANLVIYGNFDASKPIRIISPVFYIATENFYDADEIGGAHNLGSPFEIGTNIDYGNLEAGSRLEKRTKVAANIAVGLFYYSNDRYEEARKFFSIAEATPDWSAEQGKQIVYLLIGNTHLKLDEFELARENYQRALDIDPEYSRPYIGLGSVAFRQALSKFEKSGMTIDIDTNFLTKSIELYRRAESAAHQPHLADIAAKVRFGLGQCKLMMWLAGKEPNYQDAEDEFYRVIKAYNNGENKRITELTAESHARIGFIADQIGDLRSAICQYNQAILLLEINPKRQELYKERLEQLKNKLQDPSLFQEIINKCDRG